MVKLYEQYRKGWTKVRRKNKIFINILISLVLFFLVMASLGYYPGKYVLKLRLSMHYSVSDIIVLNQGSQDLLVYSDSELLQFKTKRFMGFTKLYDKIYLPSNTNHIYDSLGNEWFEVKEDLEVYSLSYDEEILNEQLLETKIVNLRNRRYIMAHQNSKPKTLKDNTGNYYWIDKYGYYNPKQKLLDPVMVDLIISTGVQNEVPVDNVVLSKFFGSGKSDYGLIKSFINFEEQGGIGSLGFEKIGTFLRTEDVLRPLIETYYYDGKDIIVSTNFLNNPGIISTDPSIFYHLNPVLVDVFVEELFPFLLD